MKPLFIQNRSFPNDWLSLVDKFNIDASTLPDSLKPLCHIIKKNILLEKENSVMSCFNRSFLRHVCLNIEWKLNIYESIPLDLIKEVFSEMGTEKGIQYNQKFSSLFSELLAYKYLNDVDYNIDSFTRTSGSCDLILKKDGEIFHCEVKAKNNDDRYSQDIIFYVNGKSYLFNYIELRKLTIVYYRIKNYPSSYSEMKELNKELDIFCLTPTYFDGTFIEISSDKMYMSKDIDRVSHDILHNTLIATFNKDETALLLEGIFLGEGRHLTKLIKKSKYFKNFIGYLHFSIPFHKEMSFPDIEEWFKSQNLNFDLYIDINGFGIEGKILYIPKKV